jgi:hypothetical protein
LAHHRRPKAPRYKPQDAPQSRHDTRTPLAHGAIMRG